MARGDALYALRWVPLVVVVCLGSGTAGADAAATSPDRMLAAASAQAAARQAPPVQAPGPPMTTIRLKRRSFEDTQGLGGEAFALLMPVDWQAEGGVNWRLDNPAFPAYGAVRISNPRGSEQFEVFPNLPFFWTNNPMVLYTNPPGSKYFGSLVRQPPTSAVQALGEIVVPLFRGQAAGLRVISAQPVPALTDAIRQLQARGQPGLAMQADAAKIRIEYDVAGGRMEEEIYGVVQSLAIPIPSMQGTVTNLNWWIDYLFSFKARKGTLDESARLLQTMAFSFQVNPRWLDRYTRLVEQLIQNQIRQIRHVGEIGRMMAQTGSEIRADNMRRWEQDQAVRDRLSEDFSRHIRGVEGYYDPNEGKVVELPAGYDHVWANRGGEYVLTNDPNFNPNIGSNLEWQPIQRKK